MSRLLPVRESRLPVECRSSSKSAHRSYLAPSQQDAFRDRLLSYLIPTLRSSSDRHGQTLSLLRRFWHQTSHKCKRMREFSHSITSNTPGLSLVSFKQLLCTPNASALYPTYLVWLPLTITLSSSPDSLPPGFLLKISTSMNAKFLPILLLFPLTINTSPSFAAPTYVAWMSTDTPRFLNRSGEVEATTMPPIQSMIVADVEPCRMFLLFMSVRETGTCASM